MFSGSMVALVTPFKDGKIDWPEPRSPGGVPHQERHKRYRPLRDDR